MMVLLFLRSFFVYWRVTITALCRCGIWKTFSLEQKPIAGLMYKIKFYSQISNVLPGLKLNSKPAVEVLFLAPHLHKTDCWLPF